MNEDFISGHQIIEAAYALGYTSDTFDVCELLPIVGKMTGLDMTKYDLIGDLDAFGWRLVRKRAEA